MDKKSFWAYEIGNTIDFPQFIGNKEADIVIVGGGIAGITTAFELIKQGRRVTLLESYKIGEGTSGNSTGNLYTLVSPFYQSVIKYHSDAVVNSIIHARAAALDYIEENVNQQQLKCGFQRRPFYYFTNNPSNFLNIERELLQIAGIKTEKNTLKDFPVPFKDSLLIPNQARFNPLAYLKQMAELIKQQGGELYEYSPVLNIVDLDSHCNITTEKGQIKAQRVIMTTHIPKGINLSALLAPAYRSYAVAVTLKKDYPHGQFWGIDHHDYILSSHSRDPNNTDTNILIAAGNHHRTGQDKHPMHNFKLLEDYLRKYFDVAEVIKRWSAQHYQAADKLPYIGAVNHRETIFIATGFFADGLVYGTLAGQMLTSFIQNKPHPLKDILKPYRFFHPKALTTAGKEIFNSFKEYAKDVPAGPTLNEIENIKPNQAKIILINGEKYAVYKDHNETPHIVSAVCTHMKCLVNWNTAEKSWDCPCHGSRFSIEGEVLEGPAYLPLKKLMLTKGK